MLARLTITVSRFDTFADGTGGFILPLLAPSGEVIVNPGLLVLGAA